MDTITITVTREQAEQLAQIVANVNVAYVISRPLIDAITEGLRRPLPEDVTDARQASRSATSSKQSEHVEGVPREHQN